MHHNSGFYPRDYKLDMFAAAMVNITYREEKLVEK